MIHSQYHEKRGFSSTYSEYSVSIIALIQRARISLTDSLRLLNFQAFQKPANLLRCELYSFGLTARPLESSVVKSFVQQQKTVTFLSEYSDKRAYPQVFVIRTFLWNKA